MKSVGFGSCALSTFAALAILSGCGAGSGTPLIPSPAGVTSDGMHAPIYSVVYSFRGGSKGGRYPFAGLTNASHVFGCVVLAQHLYSEFHCAIT